MPRTNHDQPTWTGHLWLMPSKYGNGRGGRPWRRIVERIKLRDNYICQLCKRVTVEGDVDHRIPLAKGGTDTDDNLQWLCRVPCHADKSAREANPTARIKVAIGLDGMPEGWR
ncbi:MAG: HNH endonuclease signature motif containing protein [Luteimonas sp.]